jgi:hypothetical protein
MAGRPKTIAAKRLTRTERVEGLHLVVVGDRPATRADCVDGPRPCPWPSCRHHLGVEVNPETGSLVLNTPRAIDGDFSAMADTCALDVADRGGVTLEVVGELFGVTRERVRQVEENALFRLRSAGEALGEAKPVPPRSRAKRKGTLPVLSLAVEVVRRLGTCSPLRLAELLEISLQGAQQHMSRGAHLGLLRRVAPGVYVATAKEAG